MISKEIPMERTPNRLINEKSPYLLQHAYNPVDWYPWGDEAFTKAEVENKPVFLSIGYSTCHWCHVMEMESFEDPEIAQMMNETFVNIKVDREERPDIDSIYMKVCQMATGSGGWPLTIIMLPDRTPFFAGTYFPKESRYGRPGMRDLCQRIDFIWQNNKEGILQSARNVMLNLNSEENPNEGDIDIEIFNKAFNELAFSYDQSFGGFGSKPKFPMPHYLSFLLRFWKESKKGESIKMVEKTLIKMRSGGIYDQIGFGFHRYSTDQTWLVPHFEKMLYDQALLVIAYAEAYQATGGEIYKKTVEEIIEYVARELTDYEGAFYSAQDADSEGVEGKYYLWDCDEIKDLLGEVNSSMFNKTFSIKNDGNFNSEFEPEHVRKNIPHLNPDRDNLIKDIFDSEISRKLLLDFRGKRIPPHKDDKILTDWNGLMIAALSIAGKALSRKDYIDMAAKCVDFILGKMTIDDIRLFHRYREGDAAIEGMLDDYAFFIWGLIELFEATTDIKYLKKSIGLAEIVIEDFEDKDNGGFYLTPANTKDLITRPKELYDGAIPSGNSVMLMNLCRLSMLSSLDKFRKSAENTIIAFADRVNEHPSAYTQFLIAYYLFINPGSEIIVVSEETDAFHTLSEIFKKFIPNKIVININPVNHHEILNYMPLLKEYKQLGNNTFYICRNFSCLEPITDLGRLNEELNKI